MKEVTLKLKDVIKVIDARLDWLDRNSSMDEDLYVNEKRLLSLAETKWELATLKNDIVDLFLSNNLSNNE